MTKSYGAQIFCCVCHAEPFPDDPATTRETFDLLRVRRGVVLRKASPAEESPGGEHSSRRRRCTARRQGDCPMSLPYWVAVKGDAHGGVVHQTDDGFWRANNWQGCLGRFATEGEAVLAIHSAPPRPKPKSKPLAEPPSFSEDWRLADAANGRRVLDGDGRPGAIIQNSDTGLFVAWAAGARRGDFAAADEAAAAARAAKRPKAQR